MVGNWVEILGPVVAATRAETSWPETVVLDDTWFMVTNRRTGQTTRAFSVLGAYGYPAGAQRSRTWALRASPQARRIEWEAFLRSLPGEPTMVVCDDDPAILAAVRAAWPNTTVKLCEYHLRATAIKHLRHYGHAGFGDPMMDY